MRVRGQGQCTRTGPAPVLAPYPCTRTAQKYPLAPHPYGPVPVWPLGPVRSRIWPHAGKGLKFKSNPFLSPAIIGSCDHTAFTLTLGYVNLPCSISWGLNMRSRWYFTPTALLRLDVARGGLSHLAQDRAEYQRAWQPLLRGLEHHFP
jgi:hypothetical protein